MKIIQVAPFEEPVPPKKYGGTELVVYSLAQELVAMGHEVFLVATGDSKTDAELLPVFPKALRKYKAAADMKVRDSLKYIGIGKVLEIVKNINADIIHNHIGWRLMPFAPLLKPPIVTTLHGPMHTGYQKLVYGNFPDAPVVSISNSQRRPFKKLNYVGTVYNGINVGKFAYSDKPGDYLAFLGRMSPEKGPLQAIRIAKKCGLKLVMAAKVDSVDKGYFEKEIAPLIDGKQIVFLGEVGHEGKVKLLKNARALLAPIQWEEPFGLFFIEAMACGTPVLAFRRGSVPEVVKNGVTGFAVKTDAEMIMAVRMIRTIKRSACRRWVEENFSSGKMARGYEDVYRKVIAEKKS